MLLNAGNITVIAQPHLGNLLVSSSTGHLVLKSSCTFRQVRSSLLTLARMGFGAHDMIAGGQWRRMSERDFNCKSCSDKNSFGGSLVCQHLTDAQALYADSQTALSMTSQSGLGLHHQHNIGELQGELRYCLLLPIAKDSNTCVEAAAQSSARAQNGSRLFLG